MGDIQGLGELSSSFAGLINDLESALPNLVLESAEIIEKEIQSRAPVSTGALISAIDTSSAHTKSTASATVQVEHSGQEGIEHYAIFKEFGTSKMPAEPFFRPGVAAAADPVRDHLTNGILGVINKYAD